MIEYLTEIPGMFDPSEIKLLAAALDKAWATVQASGGYAGGSAEQARAILAKHIIEKAQAGGRDQTRLSDGAVRHLTGTSQLSS